MWWIIYHSKQNLITNKDGTLKNCYRIKYEGVKAVFYRDAVKKLENEDFLLDAVEEGEFSPSEPEFE